ncbi:hypothetical protein JXA85_02830 [Candidatus Woesearchaeota archaeon]|nr:hypothetical protein [Candidatus Woesearchaeota archaeon]
MKSGERLLLIVLVLIVVASFLASAVDVAGGVNTVKDKVSNLTSGKIKFIAVNALIVAVIVYAFQKVALSKGASDKNQEALYMIIAAAVGIFAGVQYGSTMFFWKIQSVANFLHMKVIINAAVVAAFLLFIKGFVDKKLNIGDDTQAKVGSALIVIVVAVMVAMNPFSGGKTWDDPSPKGLNKGDLYPYIWEKETVVNIRLLLLGDPQCYSFDDFGVKSVGKKEVLSAPNGQTLYFKTNDKGEKDWMIRESSIKVPFTGWRIPFFDSLVGDSKVVDGDSISKANEWYELGDSLRKSRELSSSDAERYESLQTELKNNAKAGRYCYTEESKNLLLEKKSLTKDRPKYRPSESNPLKGFGILRGSQLFIFILSTLTLIMLFTSFNVSDKSWLRNSLAVFIAGNIAHDGSVGKSAVIKLFQFALWWMFSESMGKDKSNSKEKWFYRGVAAALVLYLGHIAFPDHCFYIQGITPTSFGGIVKFIIIWTLVFGALAGAFAAAATRKKEGMIRNAMKDFGAHFSEKLKNFLEKIPLIRRLFNLRRKWLDDEIHVEVRKLKVELFTMMNWLLRLEVYYTKNYFVQITKEDIEKIYAGGTGSKDLRLKAIKETRSTQNIIEDLKRYGEGCNEYYTGSDGSIKLKPKFIIYRDFQNKLKVAKCHESNSGIGGFTSFGSIMWLLNSIHKWFQTEWPSYGERVDSTHLHTRFTEFLEGEIGSYFNQLESPVAAKLGSRWGRYASIVYIRSQRMILTDQYMMDGERKRSWIYAADNAPYQVFRIRIKKKPKDLYWEYGNDYALPTGKELLSERVKDFDDKAIGRPTAGCNAEEKDAMETALKKNVLGRRILFEEYGEVRPKLAGVGMIKDKALSTEQRGKAEEETIYYEVTPRGWVVDDLNAIRFGEFKKLLGHDLAAGWAYVRKIKKQDIIWPDEGASQVRHGKAWDEFLKDAVYGKHHPMSHTVSQYISLHREKVRDFKYKHLPDYFNKRREEYAAEQIKRGEEVFLPPREDDPAFDREAMKDPGKLRFWNFRNYWEETEEFIRKKPPISPFPGLSVKGLSMYIADLFEQKIYECERRTEEMKRWVWFAEKSGKMFSNIEEGTGKGEKKKDEK